MDASDDDFDAVARPLLELVQRVTQLETSFVTRIDWDGQIQEVLVALNAGDLEVPEGEVVPWADSMCRWTFLSGRAATADVPGDFAGSLGAEQLGMQTFLAVPILDGERVVGTVCGASRRAVPLSEDVVGLVDLVATALTHQFRTVLEAARQRDRAEHAEVLARTDPLTELPNRRAFTARLEEEIARAGRQHTPVALLLADVDAFKAVNDTHGHQAGDTVLTTLAEVLRRRARAGDVAARLGGDEFALLLAGSDRAGARAAADRIEAEFLRATTGLGLAVSVSIGVGASDTAPVRDLAAAADADLYLRKQDRTRAVRRTAVASAP